MSTEKTYEGVYHRKSRGSLVLSGRGFFFRPDNNGGGTGTGTGGHRVVLAWHLVAKHQVIAAGADDKSPSSYTFAFPDRNSLEGARREITSRLSRGTKTQTGKKRPREAAAVAAGPEPTGRRRISTPPSAQFVNLDPVALVATRSALLASDPALRAQHRLLVLDGGTLREEDFWETHSRLVADEYAKISGRTSAGMSSDIKSSLDLGASSSSKKGGKKDSGAGGARAGVVRLGVEEMRQIFIMYPAVHRAYEEKVPLELSEEQFWRKYLESEYFHRDRGRIGAHVKVEQERELVEQERVLGKATAGVDGERNKRETKKEEETTMGEEEAKNRLAAAGTDDIFSRYDAKGGSRHYHHHASSSGTQHGRNNRNRHHREPGAPMAVGQFDLASTNEVERGDRFLELGDLHPPPERGWAGAQIVNKYNRHWALVLHPADSTAGVDLGKVAVGSANEETIAKDDEDAKVNGGYNRVMNQLIGFAEADENDADFARGTGDTDELMDLHLRNIDAYAGKFGPDRASSRESDTEMLLKYARHLAAECRKATDPILRQKTAGRSKGFCHAPTLEKPLPDPKTGRVILEKLTTKFAADAQTEAEVQQLAEALPDEFKNKLASFFRRASELLRHFFSLRSAFSEDGDGNGGVGQSGAQKKRLTNIVKGMEKVHGEMYEMTRNLPTIESNMFKPIMEQLDSAFKLHRDDSSKNRTGFVTIAKKGFVPVAR